MLMAAPNELIQDQRNLYRSFTLQTLICVFVGCLLPPIVYFGSFEFVFQSVMSRNSIVASVVATGLGIFFTRRLNAYPGVKQFGAVIPTFVMSFGFAAIVILSFRIPYSAQVLLLNFAVSLLAYLFFLIFASKSDQNVLYVVPGGRVKRLEKMQVPARKLIAPIIPDDRGAILVADLHADLDDAWERMLANAALRGIPVFHFKQVLEAATGKIQIEHLSENSFGSLLPSMSFLRLKRLADVALCLVLLPIAFIPLAVIAVLIKLDSPGPVFFRQRRIGYRGDAFHVLKFRTMRCEDTPVDEEKRRDMAMTGENDPRITKLGGFLRRTRIDELPQMYNIILGHMSWIGPRPEAVELSNWYQQEIPFYDYRHIVRPGITGWAQVHQGHVTELGDIDDKLQYDFYYIKNFSYWLDFLILARTAVVVLTGHGAK